MVEEGVLSVKAKDCNAQTNEKFSLIWSNMFKTLGMEFKQFLMKKAQYKA